MCGRFVLATPRATLVQRFDSASCVEFGPRYDVAPIAKAVVVRQYAEGKRTGEFHRWGLLPGWAKDPSVAAKLNNARGETVRDRMPVILSPDDVATWLDPANANPELLRTFIRPAEPSGMMAFPVSRAVNSSRNEFPDLIVPV